VIETSSRFSTVVSDEMDAETSQPSYQLGGVNRRATRKSDRGTHYETRDYSNLPPIG
jgi:hypothetical protein